MTEKTILIAFLLFAMIFSFYIYWDCNHTMKKVRKELEEIGFEFDEKWD